MRFILITFLVLCTVCVYNAVSQTKTTEKRTEKDSATGSVHTTESVSITTEEDITPRMNMITINPLKFFVFYNLSYYRKLSSGTAFGVGLQYPTIKDIDGLGINGELRFYPSAKSLRGFYIAPNASFTTLSYNGSSSNKPTAQVTSLGVLLGWQWFPGDDFSMGLGIGVDKYFLSGSDSDTNFGSYNGTLPAFRFDIGYAW